MVYFMMANGFEEAEALVPFDILNRCGLDSTLVSFEQTEVVEGAHGIKVICNLLVKDLDLSDAECIVFPGGGLGTENLDNSEYTDGILKSAVEKDLLIGAICAAPSVLGKRGYLKGLKATCYPGFEEYLIDADVTGERLAVNDKIITAKGAGAAYEFGYALASALKNPEIAQTVKEKIY